MELPESYCERMRGMLGEEYPDYLASLEEPRAVSLRVNTLKYSAGEARAGLAFLGDPVPWVPEGFYCRDGARPARHPAWYAGLYYLQEASAMAPGSVLPVREGDRILDLCAAPGGKATQAAARLGGSGVLYANDLSVSRARALLKNLEMAGAANIFVTAESPEKLARAYPEYFDGILADVPCSGEGMFRKDGSLIRDWLSRGPAYYAPLQAEILDRAADMLRPGGYLLYSTCTFSREEDEGNVEAFLGRRPEMSLFPVEPRPGFSEGFLPGTVRLWPHRVRGEGHFLALMRKRGERRSPGGGNPGGRERLRLGDRLYELPSGERIRPGLRCLRTGLFLGEWKRERFTPSQALAMAPGAGDWQDRVIFSGDDGDAVRYLKGETVNLSGGAVCVGGEGLCLVCLEEHPLGWAVRRGTVLKNKYCPGWRWQ